MHGRIIAFVLDGVLPRLAYLCGSLMLWEEPGAHLVNNRWNVIFLHDKKLMSVLREKPNAACFTWSFHKCEVKITFVYLCLTFARKQCTNLSTAQNIIYKDALIGLHHSGHFVVILFFFFYMHHFKDVISGKLFLHWFFNAQWKSHTCLILLLETNYYFDIHITRT